MKHQYPVWAITLPWCYADDDNYVTTSWLVEEIEQNSALTGWTKDQKSSQLLGSHWGLAVEFIEDLNHYQIDWREWRKVSTTFIEMFDNTRGPALEMKEDLPDTGPPPRAPYEEAHSDE
jgi:hypothetical protein